MLEAYEVDDITILFYTGRNKFNQLTYKTVKTRAYVNWRTKLDRNIAGEETFAWFSAAVAAVYINHPRQITNEDFIRINGVRHSVIHIAEAKDFSPNHQEVYIA